jgi:AraC-like DNA-binding protein
MDKAKSEIPRVPAFVEAESRGITQDKERFALWAQLVYVREGFLSVTSPSARYAATPGHAVFIPARVPHRLISPRSCELLRMFIQPACIPQLAQTTILVGNRLVEELLLAAQAAGDAYADEGPDARLVQVLLDRIATLETRPFFLPTVTDPTLFRVLDRIAKFPPKRANLDAWSAETGLSAKTAARRFEAETGMTFRNWHQRLRMLHALERLADGDSVSLVATELGHMNLAAFSAAFRRALGVPPTIFVGRRSA